MWHFSQGIYVLDDFSNTWITQSCVVYLYELPTYTWAKAPDVRGVVIRTEIVGTIMLGSQIMINILATSRSQNFKNHAEKFFFYGC